MADRMSELIKDIRHILRSWAQAYPEDIFTPPPPVESLTDREKTLRTQDSAAMGRHMAKCLDEQINEIITEGTDV